MISEADVSRFSDLVVARLGLVFEPHRRGDVRACLREQLDATGLSVVDLVRALESAAASDDVRWQAIIRRLTVGETYFFRHREQLDAFVAAATRRLSRGAPLRVLSIGCASGEEPYSLAAVLLAAGIGEQAFDIVAVDVNASALAKARAARYSRWSLRETPEEVERAFFTRHGVDVAVVERVRERVRFACGNLFDLDAAVGARAFDVVFCRNVIMYFSVPQQRAAVARIADALVDGGLLFLGFAETLRGLSEGFDLQHAGAAFYYRRRHAAASAEPPPTLEAAAASLPSPRVTEAIADAVAAQAPTPAPTPGADRPEAADTRVAPEAPSAPVAAAAAPAAEPDHDAIVRGIAALIESGRFAEAEPALERLLDAGPDATAHYLLAICREQARDPLGAIFHDEASAALDPSFALPHLRLGHLARDAGDRARARIEFCRAADLLERREDHRVPMLCDGFPSAALARYCLEQARACEDR